MTNSEINRTIAEACGYKVIYAPKVMCEEDDDCVVFKYTNNGYPQEIDFCTDANACFDACEKLGYAPCIVPNIDEHGKIIYGVAVLQIIDEGLFGTSEDELVGYEITPLLARAIAEAVRKNQ